MDSQVIEILSSNDGTGMQKVSPYFDELKKLDHAWQLCASTLADIKFKNYPMVQFFCLQVLEDFVKKKHDKCSVEEQSAFRMFLSTWVQEHCAVERLWPGYLSNKAAQVLALTFMRQYPTAWSSFFQDLLVESGDLEMRIDLYLKVLMQIDSEMVNKDIVHSDTENKRNTIIKDEMRARSVEYLVNTWLHILRTYEDRKPDLVNACLDVIGAYVSWIEISKVANNDFVPILLKFFGQQNFRDKTCLCVLEFINKGMEPATKLDYVEYFAGLFSSAGVLAIKEDDDEDYLENLAKLVNGMGLQLLAVWQKFNKAKDAGVDRALACIFAKLDIMKYFLSHENDDVSFAVCNFTHDFLTFSKQVTARSPEHRQHIKDILLIVIDKMKYDESFDFLNERDAEAEFLQYRQELRVLFNNIGALESELLLRTVEERAKLNWTNWQNQTFQDVELSIMLFFLLVEAMPIQKSKKKINKKDVSLGQAFNSDLSKSTAVQNLMRELIKSQVYRYQHPAVTIQFFETVCRYDKFFNCEPQFIPDVLKVFLDTQGMRSPLIQVCSRAVYFFRKFVIGITKTHLQPHLEQILNSMEGLLVLHSQNNGLSCHQLTLRDQQHLYETAGILIVRSILLADRKKVWISQLLSPMVQEFDVCLQELATASNPAAQTLLADRMGTVMTFVSHASKGFSPQHTMLQCDCIDVFIQLLQKFLTSLDATPGTCRKVLHTPVRQFLHRMAVCMDEEILPYVPIAMDYLLTKPEAREVHEFIPLLIHLVNKHKKRMTPFLSQALMPLMQTIFGVLNTPVDPDDQDTEESHKQLHRNFFLFLQCLISNNMTEVLTNQTSENLEQVLLTFTQDVRNRKIIEPQTLKPVFNILRNLVDKWLTPETRDSAFVSFVNKQILPTCLCIPRQEHFDLSDGQTALVLKECAMCWKTISDKLGMDFYNFIQSDLFPSYNIPVELTQQFCAAVHSDLKTLKAFLNNFYRDIKEKTT